MEYQTVAKPIERELEISRSRFLTRLERVESEGEARDVIAAVRSAHPKANHHCTAFVLEPGQLVKRSNDDGEPSGTAGAPMLDALVSAGLSDVVAVVTRYFGGVLLGAGGLTRAYRSAVADAANAAQRVTRAERWRVAIHLAYESAAALQVEARRRQWIVGPADYGADVTQTYLVAREDIAPLTVLAAELTAGAAVTEVGAAEFVDLAG